MFILPSTGFELTPLIHCITYRIALCLTILHPAENKTILYYINKLSLVSICLTSLFVTILHKNDVLFVFTSSCLYEGLCLIYFIYVCLRIVVSNICCVFALFVFVLCTQCCQFLWIVHF